MDKINPNYSEALLHGFNKLREQNHLCDVIINVGERTFHAHKAILAATSSYFAAMFTSGFKERSENEIKIDCNSKAMEILLQFAYTGRFDGSCIMDGLFDVLELSCYTESIEFSKTCSEYIVDLLESEQLPEEISLVDICKMSFLARNHDHLSELVKAADMHLENNLQRLKCSDVFLQNASASFLQEFLGRDSLFCTMDEKQVLELTVSWLKHNWEDRCNLSLQLLQKVRLGLIPSEDLKELIGSEVLEIPGCSELVNDVLKLQASETSKSDLSLEKPEFFETRGMTKASGSNQAGSSVDAYRVYRNFQFINSQNDKHYCINLPKITQNSLDNFPISNYSFVGVGKRLYVAGVTSYTGADYGNYLGSHGNFFCYEPAGNKWIKLPSMEIDRYSAAMVYLDGYIYVIGGIREEEPGYWLNVNAMERYDVIKKQWKTLGFPLPEQDRVCNSCTTFAKISAIVFQGKIIVYGMYEDKYNIALMTYDPAKNKWKLMHEEEDNTAGYIQPMLFKHHNHYYKILYTPEEKIEYSNEYSLPSVYELEIKTGGDDTINISIGQELFQPDMPCGAFRIKNDVFMIRRGLAYKINVKVRPAESQVEQSQESAMLLATYVKDYKKGPVENY